MRLFLMALVLLSAAACGHPRVVVTIENVDPDTLRSVVISTDAYTRNLGNLAPGQAATDTLIRESANSIRLEQGLPPRTKLVVVAYSDDLDSVRAQVRKDTVISVLRWWRGTVGKGR
jgi:hypothetical protein